MGPSGNPDGPGRALGGMSSPNRLSTSGNATDRRNGPGGVLVREPGQGTHMPDVSRQSAVKRSPQAASPWRMPATAWKAIALRTWREAGADNISLIASGVAFCGVLAMVPMLAAIVLSYGLIASPRTVVETMQSLTLVMPAEAAKLIGDQLANVVHTADGKKGFGLILALGIALYGAVKGAGAMVTALNIAYDEDEQRGFVGLNLLALAITAGALLLALLAIVSITAMGRLQAMFPQIPGVLLLLGRVLSYAVMAAVGAAAAATLYRYGPDRDEPRWMWLTPGSAFATSLWLIVTLGFGFYVVNFGSYDATYGALAELTPIMGAPLDEVVGPDVPRIFRPKPDAGSIVKRQPPPFR